jgi:hypothetical protein
VLLDPAGSPGQYEEVWILALPEAADVPKAQRRRGGTPAMLCGSNGEGAPWLPLGVRLE